MKRKICVTVLLIISIIVVIPLFMDIGTILTSDYIMLCNSKDKEFISKHLTIYENYDIALIKSEGFLHPSSEARIVKRTFLPYPIVLSEQIIIEKNSDGLKGEINNYIMDNDNKGIVLLVRILPYAIFYIIMINIIKRLMI